jgi:hypothetical protein
MVKIRDKTQVIINTYTSTIVKECVHYNLIHFFSSYNPLQVK